MNDYFDSADWDALARNTLARAEAVNAIAEAVEVGFDRLPGQTRLYEGRVTYCGADTGVADAYVATAPYTITLTDGLWLRFKPAAPNTGASTLNASSLGAVSVRDYGGNLLTGGELAAGTIVDVVYDSAGPYFRIINPNVDVGSVSVNNNAKVTASDTTPGPLNSKVDVEGPDLTKEVQNSGGNEVLNITLDRLQMIFRNQLYAGA